MSPGSAQPIVKALQDMGNSITSSRYVGTSADRCQRITKYVEQFMTCPKMMRTKEVAT